MPRYYFDIFDKEGVERDDDGLELESIDAAVNEARQALRDMANEAIPEPRTAHLAIQIRDHTEGPVLLSVTITSTLAYGTKT
jgi:hypothetical protein